MVWNVLASSSINNNILQNDHDEVQEQIDVCMEEACVNETLFKSNV